MEFNEMKEIWDAQDAQPLYTLDEYAIQKGVQVKLNTVRRVTGIGDWLLVLIYLVTGSVLLRLNPPGTGAHIFIYLEIAWMFATVLYLLAGHFRRLKASRRFDRTVHGDLNQAISIAAYQIRLSRFIGWNLLPLAAIMILAGWESGKFLKVGAVMLASLLLALFVLSKGQSANKRRRRELLLLKEKLEAAN